MTERLDVTLNSIARTLKAARSSAGLSLDQLAHRSKVSKGTLVKLEQGQGNPSIAVLCQVAAALGMSIADLVDHAIEQKAAEFESAAGRVVWRGPQGGSARLVAATAGIDMVELWTWELFPRERYDAVAHSPGTREIMEVTSGRLGFSLGSWSTIVRPGRGLLAETSSAHAYWCEGGRAVRFRMFVSERPSPVRTE